MAHSLLWKKVSTLHRPKQLIKPEPVMQKGGHVLFGLLEESQCGCSEAETCFIPAMGTHRSLLKSIRTRPKVTIDLDVPLMLSFVA